MKTIDEVIEQFEKQMEKGQAKILCVGTLDSIPDALNYLREYRSDRIQWEADRKNWQDQYTQAVENFKSSTAKHLEALKEIKGKNDPLTWDELRTMEGKPVWVEGEHGCIRNQKAWSLIRLDAENDDLIICVSTDGGVHYAFAIGKEDYGTDWQAYRKER